MNGREKKKHKKAREGLERRKRSRWFGREKFPGHLLGKTMERKRRENVKRSGVAWRWAEG